MADNDERTDGERFQSQVPAQPHVSRRRGTGALDWGMQSRLAHVFQPGTGRTVMLAIDHGYFQGPTTGLERVDLSILPLLPYADALMTTRGMVRSTIPPASRVPIVLRASGRPSILRELSDEQIAVAMEDADTVTAAAPVPVVMAGGKKLPELEALTMAGNAIEGGAAGVDMGRNIFQSDHPVAMIRAVRAVVHESAKPQHAFEEYVRPVLLTKETRP
jgi:DhnA family fructose-bisphosphate aldolase class Ia